MTSRSSASRASTPRTALSSCSPTAIGHVPTTSTCARCVWTIRLPSAQRRRGDAHRDVSPSGDVVLDTHSGVHRPPRTDLFRSDGTRIVTIADANRPDGGPRPGRHGDVRRDGAGRHDGAAGCHLASARFRREQAVRARRVHLRRAAGRDAAARLPPNGGRSSRARSRSSGSSSSSSTAPGHPSAARLSRMSSTDGSAPTRSPSIATSSSSWSMLAVPRRARVGIFGGSGAAT